MADRAKWLGFLLALTAGPVAAEPLCLVRYDQARRGGAATMAPAEFDLDRLEADFRLLAEHHLQPIIAGFSAAELRGAGAWLPLEVQPTGTRQPPLATRVELLDYLLTRAEAHGLKVVGLSGGSAEEAVVAEHFARRAALLALAVPADTPVEVIAAMRAAAPERQVFIDAAAPAAPATAADAFGPFFGGIAPAGSPLDYHQFYSHTGFVFYGGTAPAGSPLPGAMRLPEPGAWFGGWAGGGLTGPAAGRVARHEWIEAAATGRGLVLPCRFSELADPGALALLRDLIAATDPPLEPLEPATPNLRLFLAGGGRTLLYRETAGRSADRLYAPADGPLPIWAGATTTGGADGATVRAPVAPYEAGSRRLIARLAGLPAGATVTARAGDAAPVQIAVQGAAGATLSLVGDPGETLYIQHDGELLEPRTLGPDGESAVVLAEPSSILLVSSEPLPPAEGATPADYLRVAEAYLARGEPGRALAELERLLDRHPGTAVAALAAERRLALLAECGVFVAINLSRDAVGVRVDGPTRAELTLPPGGQERLVAYRGEYRVTALLPDAPPLESSLTMRPGDVSIQQIGRTVTSGGEFDLSRNLRGPLSADERAELTIAAADLLPGRAAAPVRPGQPAGPAAGPAPPRGPALNLVPEVRARPARGSAKETKVTLRNLTDHAISVQLSHFRPAPLGVDRRAFDLDRRGRQALDLPTGGDIGINLTVRSNGQQVTFDLLKSDGSTYDLSLRQLRPGESP